MRTKTHNICHTCLDYYGCMKISLKPAIGECSIVRPNRRLIALQDIAEAVRKKGIAFLRHPVEVTEDFCGCPFDHIVRRVSLPEGMTIQGLCFSLGTSSFGDTVMTDSISTEDLLRIKQEL